MEMRSQLAALMLFAFTAMAAGPTATTCAGNMYAFDLDSLAYMSTSVIEGDVVRARSINWIDALAIKVTHTYAGDINPGHECVVGLTRMPKR